MEKKKKSLEQCEKLDGEEMRGHEHVVRKDREHQALSCSRPQLPKGSDVCGRGWRWPAVRSVLGNVLGCDQLHGAHLRLSDDFIFHYLILI